MKNILKTSIIALTALVSTATLANARPLHRGDWWDSCDFSYGVRRGTDGCALPDFHYGARPWRHRGFVAPLPVARPHFFDRHYGPSRYTYRGYRHNDSWKRHFGF